MEGSKTTPLFLVRVMLWVSKRPLVLVKFLLVVGQGEEVYFLNGLCGRQKPTRSLPTSLSEFLASLVQGRLVEHESSNGLVFTPQLAGTSADAKYCSPPRPSDTPHGRWLS